MLDGLLIRSPWIDRILAGTKTWEIRGSATSKRGRIALIKSGTGTIVGVAEVADVVGPMTLKELAANASKAGFAADRLPYKRTFAWVLKNAQRLANPVEYTHPSGAVIWVNLPHDVSAAVLRQVGA